MTPIPLKLWVIEEAAREHKSRSAIYSRIARGKYPWLSLRRVNARVVYVDLDALYDWAGEGPGVDAVTVAREKETLKGHLSGSELKRVGKSSA